MNLFTIETMHSTNTRFFFVNAVFGSIISFINFVWEIEISRHSHYLIESYAFPRFL